MSLSNGDILSQLSEEVDTCEVVCTMDSNNVQSEVNLISEHGLLSARGNVTFEVDVDWLVVEFYSSDGVFIDKQITSHGVFKLHNSADVLIVLRSLDDAVKCWRLVVNG